MGISFLTAPAFTQSSTKIMDVTDSNSVSNFPFLIAQMYFAKNDRCLAEKPLCQNTHDS